MNFDGVEIYHAKVESGSRQRSKSLLQQIKDKCAPRRILVPGSGIDTLSKEVFGPQNCVNTGLPETDPNAYPGTEEVFADYRQNPFPNGSFDLIYLHNTPVDSTLEATPELNRVLTKNGLVVISFDRPYKVADQKKLANSYIRTGFQDVTPPEFKRVFEKTQGATSKENRGQKLFVLQKNS